MKKLLPFLSIAIMMTVYSSHALILTDTVANIDHTASKAMGFSKSIFSENFYITTSTNQSATLLDVNDESFVAPIIKKGRKRLLVVNKAIDTSAIESIPDILPVFIKNDIERKHQIIASNTLKSLPKNCWDTLQTFYVRYDNPTQRGLAGASTMILSGNVSDQEFRALFLHEIGHVFDLSKNTACLAGTTASGASEFKDGNIVMYNDDPSLQFYRISWLNETTPKIQNSPQDFVSGYAMHDVFEDFAESHTFFVLHNELFKHLALQNSALEQKYNFFSTYLYPHGIAVATTAVVVSKKRPWDITKLDYTWL